MASEKQKEYLVKLGKHLASLRKSKNLSYRKLAQNCDIDHSDIRKYELGKKNITFLTMVEFAKGLDLPIKQILDFDIYDSDQ
jgi:transcriptional regulator with XRE-family HTH domain